MSGKKLLMANVVALLALATALFVPDPVPKESVSPSAKHPSSVLQPLGKTSGPKAPAR